MKPKTALDHLTLQNQKRDSIAKFFGWRRVKDNLGFHPRERYEVFERLRPIPDYFGDANAIDRAIHALDREWQVTSYCDNLNHVCGADVEDGKASCVCYFASAAQKAEALWITIGWIKLKNDLSQTPAFNRLTEEALDEIDANIQRSKTF